MCRFSCSSAGSSDVCSPQENSGVCVGKGLVGGRTHVSRSLRSAAALLRLLQPAGGNWRGGEVCNSLLLLTGVEKWLCVAC